MDIKFSQYIGGTKVKLSAHDAPMTAIRDLTNAFVRICTDLEAGEPAELVGTMVASGHTSALDAYSGAMHYRGDVGVVKHEYVAGAAPVVPGHPDYRETVSAEEAPRKRGRPRKVPETVEDVPAVPEEVAQEAPGEREESLPEPTTAVDASGATPDAGEKSEGSTSGPATTGTTTSTSLTATTDASHSDEPAEITDTDLNRYCHRLAAHFGAPQKVFDLAAKFVPAGSVPRPTNIRNHADRAKFIAEAEEASGIRYHG